MILLTLVGGGSFFFTICLFIFLVAKKCRFTIDDKEKTINSLNTKRINISVVICIRFVSVRTSKAALVRAQKRVRGIIGFFFCLETKPVLLSTTRTRKVMIYACSKTSIEKYVDGFRFIFELFTNRLKLSNYLVDFRNTGVAKC